MFIRTSDQVACHVRRPRTEFWEGRSSNPRKRDSGAPFVSLASGMARSARRGGRETTGGGFRPRPYSVVFSPRTRLGTRRSSFDRPTSDVVADFARAVFRVDGARYSTGAPETGTGDNDAYAIRRGPEWETLSVADREVFSGSWAGLFRSDRGPFLEGPARRECAGRLSGPQATDDDVEKLEVREAPLLAPRFPCSDDDVSSSGSDDDYSSDEGEEEEGEKEEGRGGRQEGEDDDDGECRNTHVISVSIPPNFTSPVGLIVVRRRVVQFLLLGVPRL